MTPEFNNGFLVAMGLFYNHLTESHLSTLSQKLYTGSDHLSEMEFPIADSDLECFVDKILGLRHQYLNSPPHDFPIDQIFEQLRYYLNKHQPENDFTVEIEEGANIPLFVLEYFKQVDEQYYGLDVVVEYW